MVFSNVLLNAANHCVCMRNYITDSESKKKDNQPNIELLAESGCKLEMLENVVLSLKPTLLSGTCFT